MEILAEKAPLKSAILDIRIVPSPFNVNELEALKDGLKDRFPTMEALDEGQITIKFDKKKDDAKPTGDLTKSLVRHGYRFATRNDSIEFTVGADFFRIVNHRPYLGWVEFKKLAQSLWEKYVAIRKPGKIRRLALRYINHIPVIEKGNFEIYDYVTIYPHVPDSFEPSIIKNVDLMLKFDKSALGDFNSNYRLGMVTEDGLSVVLDLDVYYLYSEGEEIEIEETFPRLETLHEGLNKTFDAALNEKVKESLKS